MLAAAVLVATLGAACGSSGSKQSTASTTTAAGGAVTTATTAGATSSTAATALPTTMDDWEGLWAKERDVIVKRIKDNNWGKSADGKKLTGPSGFTVDLSKCPAGWSDTEGLTDTSIKIGQAIAQSGTLADYGNIGRTMTVLFDYYSKKGIFKDANGKTRTVDYTAKDDGYDPARTIPLVDELIDSSKVFAVWTLGSPSTMKTYDKLNQRCIPQPEAMTGHAAWGDPVNHPWTTGAPAPSYSTEAVLWGAFIEQHLSEFLAGKFTVASLVMNNDFGKLYDQAFKAFLAQSTLLKDRVNYVTETIEPTAATITDPMTTLAAKNPTVFIAMVAGTPCTQAVTEAAQNGMHEKVKYLFQPETCSGSSFVSKEKVGGDGSASNGWWLLNPGAKDFKDPTQVNDAYVKWGRQLLQGAGLNPDASSNFGAGFGYGWPMVQFLIMAGQLPGGLTRTNLILVQRAVDMTDPYNLPGLRLHMDGNKDSYFVEGGVFQKFDSVKQSWVSQGNVIDLDGKSSNCAWDQSAGICR
ncbi:MAG: branched-chain amino acid transport system substrate-binding protein [Acidimicrobiia bacterium]|jgi:branched-chain amino acid transport system substrate-binding protein|nr:branched-chain amino acid transport system substrate-binding protein [Acidimicrobiia bacterium]